MSTSVQIEDFVERLSEAEDLLAFLAEARPSRHAMIDAALMERINEHRSCYWIPAGATYRDRLPL